MNRPFAKAAEIAVRQRERARDRGVVSGLFAKKTGTVGELYVYDIIGEDWWTGGGVTANKVVDALKEMKGATTLNIFINSEGGDVFEAKAIFENLKRFDAEKVVHIDGIAASAATLIAMAGDRIITAPAATWMIHEAWSIALGPAEDMRAMADLLDMQNRDIAALYAEQTGGTVDEMLELMAAETWMNAAEAKERGFSDETAREEEPEESEAKAYAEKSRLVRAADRTQERIAVRRMEMRLARHQRDRSGLPESQRDSGLPRSASTPKR